VSEAIVIGDFVDAADGPPAMTSVELKLRALDLVAHWKRCGVAADSLAAYFAYDFEPDVRAAAVSVLSTAINELLENAAKFCADKRGSLEVSVRHHGELVRIETRHTAAAGRVLAFQGVLAELGRASLPELFAERIEHQKEPGASGIGLIILKKDYGARIGARLQPRPDGQWDVQVQVSLDVEEVQ